MLEDVLYVALGENIPVLSPNTGRRMLQYRPFRQGIATGAIMVQLFCGSSHFLVGEKACQRSKFQGTTAHGWGF